MSKWDLKRKIMRHYDASSRSYDSLYNEEQYAKFDRALKSLPISCDRMVLDAGCGSGLLFDRIATEAKMVVGLDISRNLLLLANAKRKEYENVHLVRADVDNVPFNKGVFSVVFAFTVLQNMPKPVETLESIRQAASPDAMIVVTGLKKHFSFESFSNLLERAEFSLISLIEDDSLKCYIAVLRNSS